jgi:hypothetical protein
MRTGRRVSPDNGLTGWNMSWAQWRSGSAATGAVGSALRQPYGEAHPERSVETAVVRTSLETLVAEGQAERAKQGNSVFYSHPATPRRTPPNRLQR